MSQPRICPSCSCIFHQDFVCTTCGAEKLYDETVRVLREQLAAMTQERDELREWNKAMVVKAASGGVLDGYREMGKQLAASQAREQQLRYALESFVENDCTPEANCSCHIAPPCADCTEYGAIRESIAGAKQAISLPQDDTALRQWGAKLLLEMADEYAQGAKDADKDSRVFLSEANARCAIHLRRKADELESGS